MMKVITTVLGAVLGLTALIGFGVHNFLGMDLNPLHNAFLLLMGVITLYFSLGGTEFQARYMARVLGVLFTLLGLITLFSGAGTATAGGVNIFAHHVWKLIPGHLEYTTADGVRDLAVGIVGLIAGFFPRQKEIEIDMGSQAAHTTR